ncbi:MAG: hypothetical protein JSW61_03880 [Candidatus Thorarchaeota archaeon]|nr:MAG: hypothetical protein JSW61_03880 [Candidatus Thorarchaeota archaeon]
MADEIIAAVEAEEDEEDAMTESERQIERDRETERIRKARELKKQLRKRELGLINYRWPALILILAGILAAWTEFLVVMIHPPEIQGLNTFFESFLLLGGAFYLFPLIAGVGFILCGIWAYRDPRATFVSLIPAVIVVMASMTVYFLVTFAVTADPSLEGLVYATGTPITMLITGVLSILSIFLREKE